MNIKINEKLKQLRTIKGITQEALAEHLGVTPQAISRWESGSGYPAIDYLPDIADYFEISIDECKKQVKTIIFRQFISSTFRQLKTSTFISALYPSREQIPRGYFFIT